MRNSLKHLYACGRERLRRAGVESYTLDAEVLLRFATGLDRTTMLTDMQKLTDEHAAATYEECLCRREQGVPVAYITNTIEFMSLSMHIDNRALIPRQDTEVLVERALALIAERRSDVQQEFSVLELCTGSGCIALALAYYAPAVQITATDLSAEALQLASENARRYAAGENIRFLCGNLFEPVVGRSYDMIIANPPYIPTDVIPTLDVNVRMYEPRAALDGGTDGLDFYRRLCAGAGNALKTGGVVLFEIGHDQGKAISRMLAGAGFQATVITDLSGHDRVVQGLLSKQ